MFSKRPEPRSIASQLVRLFTPAAALLLLCGLIVFYWIVVRHAFEEDNSVLADKVDALQGNFEKGSGVDALAADLSAMGQQKSRSFLVRVLDPSGTVIWQTPRMEELLPASIFPRPASREVAVPVEYRNAGKSFALTTRHAIRNGQLLTIQVAQDRSSDEKVEREFGILLLIVLAGGVVASVAIAITITRRGLRPLRQMTTRSQASGPLI